MANRSKGKWQECSVMKRDLKRARAFEIRKLIRKIKLYNDKRGEEKRIESYKRKSQRLVEEMEAMKDIDLNEIAKAANDGLSVLSQRALKEPPTNPPDKARWRILTSNCIRQSLTNKEFTTVPINHSAVPCSSDIDGDSHHLNDGVDSVRGEGTDHGDIGNNSQENSDISGGVVRVCKWSQVGNRKKGALLQLRKSKTKAGLLKKDRKKTFNNGHQLDEVDVSTKSDMTSMFVGSLSGTKRLRGTRKTRNRMGQRARRQMWETKYKEKANHIKEKGKNHVIKSNLKKTRTESQRVIKKTSANDGDCGGRDAPLHPSWEASRLRKQQQSVHLKTFQGSKIVFSDSD